MQFFLPNLNLSIIKSNDLIVRVLGGFSSLILIVLSSFFFYSYVISPYASGLLITNIQETDVIGTFFGPSFLLSISIPKEKMSKYAIVYQNSTGENTMFTSLCTDEQERELEFTKNESNVNYCFFTDAWENPEDFYIIN